jgi:hypothetical protein
MELAAADSKELELRAQMDKCIQTEESDDLERELALVRTKKRTLRDRLTVDERTLLITKANQSTAIERLRAHEHKQEIVARGHVHVCTVCRAAIPLDTLGQRFAIQYDRQRQSLGEAGSEDSKDSSEPVADGGTLEEMPQWLVDRVREVQLWQAEMLKTRMERQNDSEAASRTDDDAGSSSADGEEQKLEGSSAAFDTVSAGAYSPGKRRA